MHKDVQWAFHSCFKASLSADSMWWQCRIRSSIFIVRTQPNSEVEEELSPSIIGLLCWRLRRGWRFANESWCNAAGGHTYPAKFSAPSSNSMPTTARNKHNHHYGFGGGYLGAAKSAPVSKPKQRTNARASLLLTPTSRLEFVRGRGHVNIKDDLYPKNK